MSLPGWFRRCGSGGFDPGPTRDDFSPRFQAHESKVILTTDAYGVTRTDAKIALERERRSIRTETQLLLSLRREYHWSPHWGMMAKTFR